MIKGSVILWTIFCDYLLFSGVGELDAGMVETNDAYAAGAGIGMIGIFLIWGVVVVRLSLLGLLFKKS
ncbi:MAG TPA: hypothetical protein V6D13_07950 [Halomicronema sp.]